MREKRRESLRFGPYVEPDWRLPDWRLPDIYGYRIFVKGEVGVSLPGFPEGFEHQMKTWLADEWPLFLSAYTQPAQRAVRLHRVTPSAHAAIPAAAESKAVASVHPVYAVEGPLPGVPASVAGQLRDPVPWLTDGFYIDADSTLGKLIYHEMGAYYLQEPSAMAVAAALNAKPGERVLDLCAAPGGKTTAIGRAMAGKGVLVANEIHPSRVVVLAQNLERTGVPAVVVNEDPVRLAQPFSRWFDAVLVDAPCSGEGMFRKDPEAAQQWRGDAPAFCAARQKEILQQAIRMVRPGGRLVYSTCTFNAIENEQVIAWAVENFRVSVTQLPDWPGWDSGRPDWGNGLRELLHTRRLWPHQGRGEGHFVALLSIHGDGLDPTGERAARQPGTTRQTELLGSPNKGKKGAKAPAQSTAWNSVQWEKWLRQLLTNDPPAAWLHPVVSGGSVFAAPPEGLSLAGLRVLRPGVCLASMVRDRFEPHHNLAMAIHPSLARNHLDVDEQTARDYLSGNALPEADHSGFTWVNYGGLPLGWGKSVTGRTNNLYPKGLRRGDLSL
ncbi:RsmF rRNA methyltransferase first C-terminal domain-containing protein [Alicyclobacillus tolerans]|nr:RsmF rRNA methyltransferase first C-terminal domain-containing protein [Alicyclobacillus tolerans]